MSVSYLEFLPEIENILKNLLSQDNSVRSNTESQLQSVWVVQKPHILLPCLVHFISQHQDPRFKSFACVLLRRLSIKEIQTEDGKQNESGITHTPFMLAGSDARSFCETELLKAFESEADPEVRKKLGDTISEIANYISMTGNTWTELLPSVFKCIQSPSEHFRESALMIIASLPELILDKDVQFIKQIFMQLLQDPSPAVQIAAVKAACYYLIRVPKAHRMVMSDTIPLMIQSFMNVSNSQDLADSAVSQLGYLIELAEYHSKMFRPYANELVNLVASIMKNDELDSGIRQTALEFLLTIIECASGMMKKTTQVAEVILPIILEWMGKIDDDEDWYTTDDIEDIDNEADNIVAEQALDRFAQALGGSHILPIFYNTVPVMINSSAWQHRHAGLYAISCIAEGCVSAMENQLPAVMTTITSSCKDEHPRVRYAACNAIGQLCTDFSPVVQRDYSDLVLQHLIPMLDDHAFPRVQSHAAAALVNFFEDAKQEQVVPYLDQLVPKLAHLLQVGRYYLKEQAATTLATAAECSKEHFVKYYTQIMPPLIEILRHENVKELRTLKSRAIESVSLIAFAVGKPTVSPHAADILTLFRDIQQSIQDYDDPQSAYLLSAWARMCSVMKEDFVPYLDYVMQPLLRSARLQADLTVLDVDDDPSQYSQEEGWELVNIEGKKYGIKTSALEEKNTAIEMFLCYAKEMGPSFAPYVQEVFNIVIPLFKFYIDDNVRFTSVATIPTLFGCLIGTPQGQEALAPAWATVSEKLLDAINIEPDDAFVTHLLISYYETVEILGPKCLSTEQMDRICKLIIELAQRFLEKTREREEFKKQGEVDDDDEEQMQAETEQDENVLGELSRVTNEVFKAQGELFLSYFEKLLPVLTLYKSDSNLACRQWAICVFDDLIEFCSEKAWNYNNHFGPLFVQFLEDPSPEVRQATCYGVGICGQIRRPEFKPLIDACLPLLVSMIQHPQSRDEENILCTENAISAIGKICHFSPEMVNLNELIPFWVNSLPITRDEAEADHTYHYFLDLLENPSFADMILGTNHQNLPKVIQILNAALFTKALIKSLETRVLAALQNALSACPLEIKEQFWNQLPNDQKQVLLEKKIM